MLIKNGHKLNHQYQYELKNTGGTKTTQRKVSTADIHEHTKTTRRKPSNQADINKVFV